MPSVRPLDADQRQAWQAAEKLWGVSVHDPILAADSDAGSFAWFSFPPQVSVDLGKARASGVASFLESVFAHEIGHHVLSPSTRLSSLKITHQMARALQASDAAVDSELREKAHELSNLWSDMLINTRVAELQRRRDLAAPGGPPVPEMIQMWHTMSSASVAGTMWWVMLRAYEMLWVLPPGTLVPTEPPRAPAPEPAPAVSPSRAKPRKPTQREWDAAAALTVAEATTEAAKRAAAEVAEREAARAVAEVQRELESLTQTNPLLDAVLLAETVKTFGDDPVSGALRFGMLLAPYMADPPGASGRRGERGARDVYCGGEAGAAPATAGEMVAVLGDARLDERPEHPALHKARRAAPGASGPEASAIAGGAGAAAGGQGYGLAETLRLYAGSDKNDVIAAWYQTRARRWVRPLHQMAATAAGTEDEIPGPIADWGLGDELADIDWASTLASSVVVVPGVTTRRRDVLDDPPPTSRTSVDLDLYIDSSGSMRSPLAESPAVLAGTILILSVLRGGGRVRVTSFSAAGQVAGGERFTRKAVEAMRLLTVYFGSGTTFPLDLYAERYRAVRHGDGSIRRHVVVLSDEGLASMFGVGQEQYADVAARVRKVLETGTLILQDSRRSVSVAAAAAGYDVEYIDRMTDAPDACARLARRLLVPRG